eukprot:gnl/Spiro4/15205_TR8192_c0_g1_i1.p1 gnl/Spiro4/15205_TR8192_c0_g1~~gnl/Spiro4/15205_TR8192_c0_g1_i1.p1  ORF type:complete len:400 (+),score=39.32 gnl/Spiro4/15205_TR8192_c0_g1_i1:65-1201(+)
MAQNLTNTQRNSLGGTSQYTGTHDFGPGPKGYEEYVPPPPITSPNSAMFVFKQDGARRTHRIPQNSLHYGTIVPAFVEHKEVPGPGHYRPATAPSRGGKFSLSSTHRTGTQTKSPVAPKNFSALGHHGISTISSRLPESEVPGPGYYGIPAKQGTNTNISYRSTSTRYSHFVPDNRLHKSGFIPDFVEFNEVPGPGQYNPKSRSLSGGRFAKAKTHRITDGTQTRRSPTDFAPAGHFGIATISSTLDTSDVPGPGYYGIPPKSSTNTSQSYRSTANRWQYVPNTVLHKASEVPEFVQFREVPGPGHYRPKTTGSHGGRFAKARTWRGSLDSSPRRAPKHFQPLGDYGIHTYSSLLESSSVPGPGYYGVPRKPSKRSTN